MEASTTKQIIMETDNREEIIECLEKLKDSPLKDEEYKDDLINLCGAIKTIIEFLSYMIENKNGSDECVMGVDYIRGRLFQIYAISDVIKEKINIDDLTHINDLLYFYRKERGIKDSD